MTRNDEDLCAGWQPDLTEDLRTHDELVDDAKHILRSERPPKSFRELCDRLKEHAPDRDLGGPAGGTNTNPSGEN